jgi:hypothetical protein
MKMIVKLTYYKKEFKILDLYYESKVIRKKYNIRNEKIRKMNEKLTDKY